MVTLDELPLPPSSNSQYVSFAFRGKVIHKPAPSYKAFKAAMAYWAQLHPEELRAARTQVAIWRNQGEVFEVDCFIVVPPDKLYTQKGEIRKWDVSNRIKALHDQVAEWLGLDDSHFFVVRAEKMLGKYESATFQIKPVIKREKKSKSFYSVIDDK